MNFKYFLQELINANAEVDGLNNEGKKPFDLARDAAIKDLLRTALAKIFVADWSADGILNKII